MTIFNKQKSNRIEWAKWSWNPVTGCLFNCRFCYAKDFAQRYNPNDEFKPAFHPERLDAPQKTKIPKDRINEPGIRNVFVCSMSELFGSWVPVTWINATFQAAAAAPQWNFIFLTKNPARYHEIVRRPGFPPNCWIGATADTQKRANAAVEVFAALDCPNVKFISCEPLLEPIVLSRPDIIDWLIIGGCSRTKNFPATQPDWAWTKRLLDQAAQIKLPVYVKPNLTALPPGFKPPKEYPHDDLRPHLPSIMAFLEPRNRTIGIERR